MNHKTSGNEFPIVEDISDILNLAKIYFNANTVNNYVESLINRIGRVIFVNNKGGKL